MTPKKKPPRKRATPAAAHAMRRPNWRANLPPLPPPPAPLPSASDAIAILRAYADALLLLISAQSDLISHLTAGLDGLSAELTAERAARKADQEGSLKLLREAAAILKKMAPPEAAQEDLTP